MEVHLIVMAAVTSLSFIEAFSINYSPLLRTITTLNYTSPDPALKIFYSTNSQWHRPIRVHVHPVIDNEFLSDQVLLQTYREVMVEVVDIIQALIKVFPVTGTLRLGLDGDSYCRDFLPSNPNMWNSRTKCKELRESRSAQSCEGFSMPLEYFEEMRLYRNDADFSVVQPAGPGVNNTDFILFAGLQNLNFCVKESFQVAAFTFVCRLDQFGRPISAWVNVCPRVARTVSKEKLKTTVLHEVFHALGFSFDMVTFFPLCDVTDGTLSCTRRYIGHTPGSVTDFFRTRGNDEMVTVISQKVQSLWKQHVQCEIDYGPGFNKYKGTDGTVYPENHWNMSSVMDSLLISVIPEPYLVTLDPLTLAFLEESGWYTINETAKRQLDPLIWGRNGGCDFATYSYCKPIADGTTTNRFFCSKRKPNGCHYLHLNKGVCTSVDGQSVCQYYKPYPDSDCIIPRASNSTAEMFCEDCRCFETNLHLANKTATAGVCLKRQCVGGNLQVLVNGSWINCPYNTTYYLTDGSVLLCPNVDVLCTPRDKSLKQRPESLYSTQSSTTTTTPHTTASNTVKDTKPHINRAVSIYCEFYTIWICYCFITFFFI